MRQPGPASVRSACASPYARTRHKALTCAGCEQNRRHLATGLCARCFRLSRTRLVILPRLRRAPPFHFGDRCERCKRRAAARAGSCQDCGKEIPGLWSGRGRTCDQRNRETSGACADYGERAADDRTVLSPAGQQSSSHFSLALRLDSD
jgi:hypothetical protein